MFTRLFLITSFIVALTGCNTVAGTVRGMGEDVKSGTDTVANWVKPEQGAKK
jgi:predicted small secreted protein